MSPIRHATALCVFLIAAGCTTGQPTALPATPTAQPSPAPSASPTLAPSASPTLAPSAAPSSAASLDPSLSDAGIVGRATVSNDSRAGRDGTYDIVGVSADGSECGISFEGDEFITTAWNEAAPDGQLNQMSVSIPSGDVPAADGERKTDITDGRATFNFVAASGIGTQYTGDPTEDDRTSVTIDVTRQGTGLLFEFEGTTWDAVSFSGEAICANAD